MRWRDGRKPNQRGNETRRNKGSARKEKKVKREESEINKYLETLQKKVKEKRKREFWNQQSKGES